MNKPAALAAWYALDALADSVIVDVSDDDIDAFAAARETVADAIDADSAAAASGEPPVSTRHAYLVAHALTLVADGEVDDVEAFVAGLEAAWSSLATALAVHEATARALDVAQRARSCALAAAAADRATPRQVDGEKP